MINFRHWMIINKKDTRQITQREIFNLANLSQTLDDGQLCIDGPGMPTLRLDPNPKLDKERITDIL